MARSIFTRFVVLRPDVYGAKDFLLITYQSEPMTMWPIFTRVNTPENDDPSLLDRVGGPSEWWAPLGVKAGA